MKVLLPTDFSLNAKYAIDYALKLFENEKVDFYLWHVIRASSYITDDLITVKPTSSIYDSVISGSKESIEGLKEDLINQFKNQKHTYHTLIDYDNFIDAMNQVIETEGIDLIVMGSKGSSNLEKMLFGSNTIQVIQRTCCPVLAVPYAEIFKPIHKIAFTSNYKTEYNEEAFEILRNIATIQHSEIEILHVYNDDSLTDIQRKNKKLIHDMLQNLPHQFVELDGKNLYDTIHNYLNGSLVNLLCITNKKHNFIERLFNISNVEIEVSNITMPLLVIDC